MDLAFWVSALEKERKSPMKKLSIIFILLCASLVSIAQDVIVKKDGSTIRCKVMQTNGTVIWYKEWSNQDSPLNSIDKKEVDTIDYQNDRTESNNNHSLWQQGEKMERVGRNLTINGRVLSDEEVLSLVGQDNYETYLSAKKQINAGRVFSTMYWISLGTTTALIAAAYIRSDSHHIGYYSYTTPDVGFVALAYITGFVADSSLPLMCIFKGIGKGRLNWVADDYNRNGRTNACSYQLSPSIMK